MTTTPQNNIKKLTIPREKWGKGSLLLPDGKMCCLGHLGKACGYTDDQLRGNGMPGEVSNWGYKYPNAFKDMYGADEIAAQINDADNMSGPEKERQLKILFKSRGIKLNFTGKGKP